MAGLKGLNRNFLILLRLLHLNYWNLIITKIHITAAHVKHQARSTVSRQTNLSVKSRPLQINPF